ncbi:MAG: YceI family protein [Chitinophagaceae bacterium]
MATWTIDTAHSEIGFKVKHLVVSTASGKFTSFEGTLEAANEDFSDGKVTFSADINSVNTGNEQRDAHLKSADFFDADKFPKLTFVSTSVEKTGNDFKITGDLTLKGVTRSIVVFAEFGGIEKSLYGQTVAGFEVTTKINRQDFGLTWSAVTEAGGLVVANDVRLQADVELIKS